jgi:hypothetical protein
MLTHTHAYTRYFTDDDLAEIKAGFQKLESSYLRRKEHMSPKAASAIERRLDVLRHAWAMLLEPVPSAYE